MHEAVMQFAFRTLSGDYSVGTRGIAGADYAGFSWIGKIDCLDETYPFPKWSEKPLGELARGDILCASVAAATCHGKTALQKSAEASRAPHGWVVG
ncbi:hypothetical protein [Mesorhizobium captivum]|uniref:hypothetical protein n=1 Tax=Mesorhizobium captivum TaxID=3072319 RepID=UPI002A245D63|nr:hypothetical protein [Mesorhizobium sp. VK23E]MDX8516465.1 hypothetical protein [Mesorhizobium sp. VK23E]